MAPTWKAPSRTSLKEIMAAPSSTSNLLLGGIEPKGRNNRHHQSTHITQTIQGDMDSESYCNKFLSYRSDMMLLSLLIVWYCT